ncbi:hypothetical protein F2Q69_00014504 [Brassica cretica]|uniref:Uncharacterized protein n=1 Tax=Brassica cretica TaxID=69181 RepID=A0A8S9QV95_BRACR|nr:hypothetical protein F2Q69_00014504 [Brassica cretica]
MRPCQPILSKPKDGEVLLLYLKEQKRTGSAVLVQRANIFLHIVGPEYDPQVRFKGHWQGRQRSSPASGNLHVSKGSTPKPSGSWRINSRTTGPQEDISAIAGFQEYTSKITKGKDLRPAKSTQNCRTTRPTKVLLPRSYPLYLEGTPNGSTEGNMCYLDNNPRLTDIESGPYPEDGVRCCIKSTLLQVQTRQAYVDAH